MNLIDYINSIKQIKNKQYQDHLFDEIKKMMRYYLQIREDVQHGRSVDQAFSDFSESDLKILGWIQNLNIEKIVSLFPEEEVKIVTQKSRKSKEQCVQFRIQQKAKMLERQDRQK